MSDRVSEACKRWDLAPAMEAAYRRVFDKCADWTRLTNSISEHEGIEEYALAQRLHQIGLLDERRTCLWGDEGYRGKRVEFRQSAFAQTPNRDER